MTEVGWLRSRVEETLWPIPEPGSLVGQAAAWLRAREREVSETPEEKAALEIDDRRRVDGYRRWMKQTGHHFPATDVDLASILRYPL